MVRVVGVERGGQIARLVSTDHATYTTMIDCYYILATPLVILGCALSVYSFIAKSSIHHIEGSLYFIGPILLATGGILFIKVLILKREYSRIRRAQQLGLVLTGIDEIDELNIRRTLGDQPPSYRSAVMSDVISSHESCSRHSVSSSQSTPPPTYEEHLITATSGPPSLLLPPASDAASTSANQQQGDVAASRAETLSPPVASGSGTGQQDGSNSHQFTLHMPPMSTHTQSHESNHKTSTCTLSPPSYDSLLLPR